ncbi:MAG TPA: Ig-like domain-containing protein [Gemmatimonadaceae bacterium]
MTRIGHTLTAMIVAALSGWSCSSTAPDATPQVASIVVTPAASTLALNAQLPLQAQVQDGSGTAVPGAAITWTVQDPKIVSVSAAGVVTALALGSSQVAANSLGKSGIATITVTRTPVASVVLLPTQASVAIGATVQLSASALDAGGGTLTDRAIIWTTSNPGIATVNASGLVTGVAAGSTTITAASEGKTSTSTVTVSQGAVASVDITPASLSLQVGQTQQLVASAKDGRGNVLTGKTVVWASDNLAVATVNGGSVLARSAGTAKITATVDGVSGKSDVSVTAVPIQSVSVSPPALSLAVGQTASLSATVVDAGGNTVSNPSVAWSSRDPAVASVNPNTGVVTAVSVGSTTIDATSGGKKGSSTVTVTPPPIASITISPSSSNASAGQVVTLAATVRDAAGNLVTGSTVTWTSSDVQVAAPSSTGKLTADVSTSKAGGATITATIGGVSGTATITVTPGAVATVNVTAPSSNLKVGNTMQLTATAYDSKGNTVPNQTFFWSSSNTNNATVDANGLVTGKRSGSVTIKAQTALLGGKSDSVTISVK